MTDIVDRVLDDLIADITAPADLSPSEWVAAYVDGVTLAPYQAEILDALIEHRKVSARGPRGLGKTTLAALAILWFVHTHNARSIDWKLVSTSGSWFQLRNYLWPEVHKWAHKIDYEALGVPAWRTEKELLKTEIQLLHGAATATSPDKPELIEGAHAEAVMVLFDESKIISTETFDAVEGVFSNVDNADNAVGYALAVSTPGAPIGRFYDVHRRRPGLEDWWVRHVTLKEAVAAGRIGPNYAERLAKLWGTDSAAYRNHVLGEFAGDDGGLIALPWVEAAIQRWHEWKTDPDNKAPQGVTYGVDVAREGRDQTCIAIRRGNWLLDQINYEAYTDNIVDLADQIAEQLRPLRGRATVDADGMGVGTHDRLRQLGINSTPFFGGKPVDEWRDTSTYLKAYNRRSAAWWHMRELLDPALDERRGYQIALPPDDRLIGDLTGPRRVINPSGDIKIEAKAQTKKRLHRSPDCFVEGTLVHTPTGQRAIETIRVGELVTTPWGSSRVLHVIEQHVNETIRVELDGRTIEGKPGHHVVTLESGWTQLKDLRNHDTVLITSWSSRILLKLLKPSSTTTASTGFKHALREVTAVTTSRGTSDKANQPGRLYIGRSSKIIRARYLRVIMFTILTAILSTTSLTISRRSRRVRTWLNTPGNGWPTHESGPKPSLVWRRAARRLLSGIGARKVASGIELTDSQCGPTMPDRNERSVSPANHVANCSTRSRVTPGSVRQSVTSGPLNDLADMSRFPQIANIAVKAFSLTGTARRGSVVAVARHYTERQRSVYDLTLESDNAYWANGVLAENCGDAVVYAFWAEPVIDVPVPDEFTPDETWSNQAGKVSRP